MSGARDLLADRLRLLLASERRLSERAMFGTLSFMVNGKLAVSALKDGGLLVRVADDRYEELLGRPGARRAEMGPGRDMGPGWIEVSADAVDDDETLATWLTPALDYNRSVTSSS
ncbi:hypothetical protein C6V83_11920 [Gordonia iterans]|uniref:TfoX N-terminal domain-containing protein n=1 Tax=Gordonia iterans TaxID=1004901 RepID=A0A2S0KGR3_9ACTN|nr:TfoX/Sxy family protein [Gordonia iterans]AVM00864.1 hypothetical protein C6V83_11920 [Gordonia iterans]